MKKTRKALSIILCLIMVLSMIAVSVTSTSATIGVKLGDINGDTRIDLKDVLLLQKHIAILLTLDEFQLEAANVNGDFRETDPLQAVIDMEDVLLIQKHIAKIIDKFPADFSNPANGQTQIITDSAYTSLDNAHTTIVYTPPGYTETKQYPVIYAHDGQNLFYDETSAYGSWGLLPILDKLINEGTIEPVIMVGVYNNSDRMIEYAPSDGGDIYLNYIVDSVKPYIDSHYSTKPDRDNTAIFGSSMGGLISLYAGMKYNDTFSKAGVVSPSIWYDGNWIIKYINEMETLPVDTKLWIDAGTGEQEAYDDRLCDMAQNARSLSELLMFKGYNPVDDFLYYEVPNAAHNEAAWNARAHMMLTYLFGTQPITQTGVDILNSVTTNKEGSSLYPIPAVLCNDDIIYTPVWEELTMTDPDGIAELIQPGNRVKSSAPGEVTVSYTAFGKTAEQVLTFIEDVEITLTFNVTVPEGTPADADIRIVGNADIFGGWNPKFGAQMTKVDDTHYTFTTTALDIGTTVQYKYVKLSAAGDWSGVEKDADGKEISDRGHTVTGIETFDEVVLKWAS